MRNGINQRSGIHLVVEDNTKNPSIVSKGISVMPGTETNIGLQGKELMRLASPFKSNCTTEYKNKRVKEIIGSDFAYSSKVCKGICYASKFYGACSCVYPPVFEGFVIENWFRVFAQKKIRVCNVTQGSEDQLCLISNAGTEGNDTDGTGCGCNPECRDRRYGVSHFRKVI